MPFTTPSIIIFKGIYHEIHKKTSLKHEERFCFYNYHKFILDFVPVCGAKATQAMSGLCLVEKFVSRIRVYRIRIRNFVIDS